jgi:putative aldouronate transport system permease protein
MNKVQVSATNPSIKNVFKKSRRRVKWFLPFYIMFAPVLLYYIIFHYIPMIGIIIAFKDYNFLDGIIGSSWVGLKNFQRFLHNADFLRVFYNTVILSLLRELFGFPAPIIFALLLNEIKFPKFKKLVQTISYLPHFISWVVISGILFSFFSSTGLINKLIIYFGNDAIPFLASEKYFRQFLVGTAIWKELGWSAIIYLAALAGVDQEMYEASVIDGANRKQQMWYITIPSIRNVVSIMFVLSFAQVLNAGFEQVLVLINPSVSSVAEIIDYYVYRTGLLQVNNYSYATAVGLFKSIISLCLVLVTNWGAKKIDEEGAIW